ncbi:MAG: SDR family oxidoreductase [Gemmobacter sp.]
MTGKVAVVTGAGAGIGRATALELARQGWRVALAGRREALLHEVAVQCAEALAHPADVSDPGQVEALFAATVARWGRIDLLFNNAGMGHPPTPIDEIDEATWRRVVDVNLNGMFWCMRAAFRQMKAQDPRGGRIINNGSIAAYAPRPLSAGYTATKHAVSGLTRQGALDGRAHGIAVGQIDIGNAATDMTLPMAEGVLQADGSRRPEPRLDVDHVARTVAHMASLPLEANMLFVNLMSTAMPFVGRG